MSSEEEQFEIEFSEWLKQMEQEIEATRASERITAEDLATMVY